MISIRSISWPAPTLVKDERFIDKFDRVFGEIFKGVLQPATSSPGGIEMRELPEEWLRLMAEKTLTAEEKAEIEAMGGFEKLMETLRQRLEEQKERHQGGNKWIGTAGTSPFGANGYNPEGVRIGQSTSRNKSAVKIWDKREFKNLGRRCGNWHPEHEGGAAPAAAVRARGCGGPAGSAWDHRVNRAQRRLSRSQDDAGAA